MGLIDKRADLREYWSTSASQVTPFFNSVMSVNLFRLIHRMVHTNDTSVEKPRGHKDFDAWIKVRCVLDAVNNASKFYYKPSQYINIDESMIGMKNQVIYIQYMPQKRHARFGIKKFQLCDNNGLVVHMELYAGKDFDVHREEGLAIDVVKDLCRKSRILNKGYMLFTDNFYTKPKLAEFLLENKTTLWGPLRSNSVGLPKGASQQLPVGSSKFWRKGEMVTCAFREKKSQRKTCAGS